MTSISHLITIGQDKKLLDPLSKILNRIFPLPKPKTKKKIFPHLGASVLVRPPKDPIEALYHPIERVVMVLWTLSDRCNYYKNIEFRTDFGKKFYLDDVEEDRVEVIWPRRSTLTGSDVYYYIDKFGETLREQLISSQGDVVFEAFEEGQHDYFN